MITPRNVSVVVPVGHSYDIALKITQAPLMERAQIILVADSNVAHDHLLERLPSKNEREVVILRNPARGAASARNFGLTHAKRDYVWFLDSDCLPVHLDWNKITELFENKEIVGLGGTTIHRAESRYADLFFQRFELTCFYGVQEEALALWAPSCNLFVKRHQCSSLDGGPFPSYYPRSGGGEDVHFCFALNRFGYFFRTTAMMVEHPPWMPWASYFRKFARWGWAEGVLTCRAPRHNGLVPHRMSPALLTIIIFFVLCGASVVGLRSLTSASIVAFVVILFSLACEALIESHRVSSLKLVGLSIIYMWLFEFMGLLARLYYCRPDLLLVELRYFQEQRLITICADVWRIAFFLSGLIVGFCATFIF